jgi:signal transduction histidine kinase
MSKEFLRRLELFANLSESDLDWLSGQMEPVSVAAGEILMEEGRPGDSAYIVEDGEFDVVKKSDVQDIVIAVREPGEVVGEMALLDQAPRMATVRAVRDSRVLKIRGETLQQLLSQSPSAAMSILHIVSKRLRQNEGLLRQNEKMAALGTLTAGLAHELNNPASAVLRSSDQLRAALRDWSKKTIELDQRGLTKGQIDSVNHLRGEIETHRFQASGLDPLTQNDRENELQTWLEVHGVQPAWELAPTLLTFGWDANSLADLERSFDAEILTAVLNWLAAGCLVYTLLNEVSLGTERIAEIVKSVKAYSYLDQAPIQQVDITRGLENTLVILRYKMKDGIKVIREYAPDLPFIEAYGSELNQVWTNIIDNAIDAMQGKGELILRTRAEENNVVVEVEDNGPGIPAGIQKRIFEPFFTTKPPGMGTGMGLHIAYTIINNHYGRIQLKSGPGRTCFQVMLPIQLSR